MAERVYLRDNPNPYQRQYTSPRREVPSGVVAIHTAENTPDFVAFDGGAEAVARFISTRKDAGSYHTIADSDSRIRMVRYEDAAWHDGTGTNHHSVGLSFATRADAWPLAPKEWRAGAIEQLARAAEDYARWLHAYNGTIIPAKRITESQARKKVPGFISHAELDPKRRTDPGKDFPWVDFLARYAELTRDLSTTPPGAFDPNNKEDYLMAEISETRLKKIVQDAADSAANRVIGQVWVGTAETNTKLEMLTRLAGEARGWLAAIATKLYGSFDSARKEARAYDLNNDKRKG